MTPSKEVLEVYKKSVGSDDDPLMAAELIRLNPAFLQEMARTYFEEALELYILKKGDLEIPFEIALATHLPELFARVLRSKFLIITEHSDEYECLSPRDIAEITEWFKSTYPEIYQDCMAENDQIKARVSSPASQANMNRMLEKLEQLRPLEKPDGE